MTPGVVFDCMVLVQAVASPDGPAGACFRRVENRTVELYVSDATAVEFDEVIRRPKLRRKLPALTDERIRHFVELIARVAVRIDPVPAVVTLARDPKDEKYLNLAVAAKTELIVSRDNDLLDLMTGTDADAVAFRTAYPAVRVLDPVALLQTLLPHPPTA